MRSPMISRLRRIIALVHCRGDCETGPEQRHHSSQQIDELCMLWMPGAMVEKNGKNGCFGWPPTLLYYCNRRSFRTQFRCIPYFWLKVRNLVAHEHHAAYHDIPVYARMWLRPCGTKIMAYGSSRTLDGTEFLRVRKFLRLQYVKLVYGQPTQSICGLSRVASQNGVLRI